MPKKRTVQPFYGKVEQRLERKMREVSDQSPGLGKAIQQGLKKRLQLKRSKHEQRS